MKLLLEHTGISERTWREINKLRALRKIIHFSLLSRW